MRPRADRRSWVGAPPPHPHNEPAVVVSKCLGSNQGSAQEPVAPQRPAARHTDSPAPAESLSAGTDEGVDPRTALFTGLTRDGLWFIDDGKIQFPVANFRFNQRVLE